MLAILATHPIQYQVPLWQALAKAGSVPFEVWYLSDHATRPSFDSQFEQSFAWDLDMLGGYPSQFLKAHANQDVARFSQLRLGEPLSQQLQKKKVKALWIQGWQVAAYWQAVWQAQAAGVPVWIRGESNDLAPTPFWKKQVKQVVLGQLFSRISNFLYIGKANRRLYEQFGVKPRQLHPAYYCVDNGRFKKQADELRPLRSQIRHEWGIPDDSFCILFAGKFIEKKRPMDLIDAAMNLQKTGEVKPIHLLFTGSGELGDNLREACKVVFDAKRDGRVANSENYYPVASFTGFLNQTEISKAYVASDCLVLPSDHRETWGLVVNEAMASGLPCLVSDNCGCAEDLVADMNPEFCFPTGNIEKICRGLVRMYHERVGAVELQSRVDKYDVAISVKTVNKLYPSSTEV